MKILSMLLLTSIFAFPCFANDVNRFQTQGQVILEEYPDESYVMQVFLVSGFATKLEFDDEIKMTVNGNNLLIDAIESVDKRSLIVYPKKKSGVTNLLVDTKTRKLNYEIVVGKESLLDYRVKGNTNTVVKNSIHKDISFKHLVRLANNYTTLKELGIVNDEQFRHKEKFEVFHANGMTLTLKNILSYRNPHYLFFEIEVKNDKEVSVFINKENSIVFANNKEFKPKYTYVYAKNLEPKESADGWIVLERTQLSMDNNYRFAMEINNENYIFE